MAGKKQNQWEKIEYVSCLFCHRKRHKKEKTCPNCGIGGGTHIELNNCARPSSCNSGDQARRADGEYQGGYVD